jgi:DNA topoisomerase-1
MNIVIVESKSKIKTIEKILGKDYKVFASSGHIDNLPKKELGIDIENNFKPTYKLLVDKKKYLDNLKQQCEKGVVWLATDKDFEGERIAEALRKYLRLSNFKRVYFTEITPKAILESFKNPSTHLNNLYLDCQETRRIMDRLIGYKLSPILWKHFPMNNKNPISIGRVQAATLAIVMNRDKEIEEFSSAKNWVVTGFFINSLQDTLQAVLHPKDLEHEIIVQLLGQLVGNFTAKCLDPKHTKSYPSKPFITSSLQQASYSALHFPIQKTMKLAQELYEKGHITYIRTDSAKLSDDFVQIATQYIAENYGQEYVLKIPRNPKNNKNAQEAHEAIRPTRLTKEINLSLDHQKLYELIWKRSIAYIMTPAIFQEVEIQIKDASFQNNEYFKDTISELIFDGYLKLENKTIYEKWKGPLTTWKSVTCNKIEAREKFGNFPIHFDESGLVKKMEQEGIGRPATYVASISKLVDKKYIEKKDFEGVYKDQIGYIWKKPNHPLQTFSEKVVLGKEKNKFGITELGGNIIKFLEKYFSFAINIGFTKEMEIKIDDILNQQSKKHEILNDFYKILKPLLEQPIEKTIITKKANDSLRQFKIGRKLYHIKDGPYGPYLHYKEKTKVKNISLTAYLQFSHKSLDSLMEKDVKLLTSLPIEYKDHCKLEYGRYGFYSRQENLTREQINEILIVLHL